jgi:hypothetical protein
MLGAEIIEARKKWIAYLKNSDTLKTIGKLEDPDNPNKRCCLGHACHIFEVERQASKFKVLYDDHSARLPESLVLKLGMWSVYGSGKLVQYKLRGLDVKSLSSLNDDADYTPQQIGEYLETVIEGGDDTPFKSL